MWSVSGCAAAKEEVFAARMKRVAPYMDKTIYMGWNGMVISAYIERAGAGFAGGDGVRADVPWIGC